MASAHVWVRDDEEQWAVWPVEDDQFGLTADPHQPLAPVEKSAGRPLVVRHCIDGRESWLLIAPAEHDVWLNGLPVPTGIAVLNDMDEIRIPRVGPEPVYFSTERLPRAVAFPESDRVVCCPRCRLPIEPGSPAVKCPACGIWHHQDEAAELPCWTYGPACTMCGRSTDLSAGFARTPEGPLT